MNACRMLVAMLIVGALATPASAQAPSQSARANEIDLTPGTRVKFAMLDVGSQRSWEDRRLVVRGTLTDVRSDSLVLELGGAVGRMTVARSALADLSVSRGMQRGWRAHPARAALQGAILTSSVALLASTLSRESTTPVRGGSTVKAMMGVSVGLSAGMFARTAFGRTERWEAVR